MVSLECLEHSSMAWIALYRWKTKDLTVRLGPTQEAAVEEDENFISPPKSPKICVNFIRH